MASACKPHRRHRGVISEASSSLSFLSSSFSSPSPSPSPSPSSRRLPHPSLPLLALTLALFTLLSFASPAHAAPFKTFGVNVIPLLDNQLPPWIHSDHYQYYGPLGAYLTTLLQGCGYNEGYTFVNFTNSSRIAEYEVLTTDVQIAFPVSRVWTTSSTTLSREAGGAYFLPVIESPGTLVFIYKNFKPTTLADALLTPSVMTVLLLMICVALIGGTLFWLFDHVTPNPAFENRSFLEGVFSSFYWAIVSSTTVGYGDVVPYNRLARVFAMLFILAGITLNALLQSSVIGGIVSTKDVSLSQLQLATSMLDGLNVGVVKGSVEEWRMRARGANVTLYQSVQAAMRDLDDPDSPLEAMAVDTLAAAVIFNTYGAPTVRPSGTISDPVIYGFVLNEQTARLPASLANSTVKMNLAACLDTLIRAGPIHYSRLIYFRGLDTYLQFSLNQDLEDQADQQQVAYDAMVQSAIFLPVAAGATLIAAYLANMYWVWKGRAQLQHVSTYVGKVSAQRISRD